MSDNISITSGSGLTVKTDDIGGVHYQQIKLVDGNLDSTAPTGVKDNPLIVSMQNTGATVTITGGVSILSSGVLSVNATILNTRSIATVSGGVTILSSTYLAVNINSFTSGTVSLLNTATPGFVSGGVTLLSATSVTVTGGVTILSSGVLSVNATILNTRSQATVSGGTTILSSIYLDVNVNTFTGGTVSILNTATPGLVTGGVSLLSSTILNVYQGSKAYSTLGFTPTWIYAALSSNNQTVVWKPVATKRFNVTDITVNCLSSSTVTITQDTAATVTLMKLSLMDRGGWVSNLQTPLIASQTNHGLVVTSTEAGTNSYICLSGYESA